MINRILLYNSGGGIGDALQILPLINALRNEFKNANFSYLCAHENHFNSSLKDLNRHINTLNLNIKYFGFRWWHFLILKERIKKYKINKFDLIIDLQSKIRNSLILKMIPHKFFVSSCFNFKFSKPSLNIKKINKDKILVETDGPVRFSRCFENKTAQIVFIPSIVFCASKVLHVNYDELCDVIEQNS